MIRPVYSIYRAVYVFGGPWPGYPPNPWILEAMYNKLEPVRDFLIEQKAGRKNDRYETEPVDGSFELYRVDVEIDLHEDRKGM